MTRSSLEAAALSSGVNGEVTNGESIKVTVTDTGSEMMRFADSACGVVHRATINVVDTQTSYNRKSSSSSSEPEVIDLISDNDSSVESVPMEEIKRSQVHGMACEDGSSEMKFHEFSTPRKAEISVSMGGEELTFKTNEEKNTGPLNNLKKRSASEVTNDAEARNCKNTKGRTPVKPGDLIEKVEPGLEIGSCIYAQWEEEGWHFATIYDVKRGSTPASTRYSVFFHDGDIDDSMPREKIETMQDLERICIEKGLSREYFSPEPLKPDIAAKLEAILKTKNVPLSLAIEAMKTRKSNAKTDDKFLAGRTFYRAWADLKHQRKVVYGEVIGYEEDADGDVTACTVHYTQASRELMNSFGNSSGATIPESESVIPEVAIGACLSYEEQVPPAHPLSDFIVPFHWNWLTPDCVREDVVDGLPRVTMIYRGYKLELSVDESSIAGAGKGVFLSCTQVAKSVANGTQDAFTLTPGELLDIGIYAPLRPCDKKTEAVFTTKNFMHSSKSEEWAFGYFEYQLDTTDDITGDLRADAKARIQAYVNESSDEEKVCVYACNDPENCVHYMLGHGKKTQRKFSMPADGRKREIFVDYGEAYEKVRVRKGYSVRPMAEQQLIYKELEDADVATIMYMNEFSASEVEQASNFLFDLFTGDNISKFTEKVIERALICAAVLRRRMRDLCLEGDVKSSIDGQALLSQSKKVVAQILKLSKANVRELEQFHAHGDVNGLLKAVLERQQFSADQRNELSDLL